MQKIKCAVLTTDTTHHRYFVNRLVPGADVFVVLESEGLDFGAQYWKWVRARKSISAFWNNPYLVKSYKNFNRQQEAYEERYFADGIEREFSSEAAYVSFPSVNNDACIDALREFGPDLVVSFGTGKIGRPLLELDALKLNIHRGLLPPYRGLDSDLWAMHFSDFGNIGTTVHKLEPDLDTGTIIAQNRIEIAAGMRAYHIRYHTTVFAADAVVEVINKLSNGVDVTETPWDRAEAGYYSFLPYLKRRVAIRQFHEYTDRMARETAA